MADLYVDISARIKASAYDANGVSVASPFGTITTLDSPDDYAGDPLVQLVSANAVSIAEVWEATEYFYAQLDLESAQGLYLERLHGERVGIPRASGETDDSYRARLFGFIASGLPASSPAAIAISMPWASEATVVISTPQRPVAGMPDHSAMLAVKTCAADWPALAAALWARADLGLYDWVGDISHNLDTGNGGCQPYKFQPACRVFAGMDICGYWGGPCEITEVAAVKTVIAERLKGIYAAGFGHSLTEGAIIAAMGVIPGFTITSVGLVRRAPELWGEGCATTGATTLTVCSASTPWVSSQVCGFCQGEVWCNEYDKCLTLRPWEFIDFDPQFLTIRTCDPCQ